MSRRTIAHSAVSTEQKRPRGKRCQGKELRSNGVQIITLSARVRDSIGRRLEFLPCRTSGFEEHLWQLRRLASWLPIEILRSLGAFRNDPAAPGSVLLRNWPQDRVLPKTPSRPELPQDKSTFVSENALLAIAALLGEPYGVADEQRGQLIHHVIPVKGAERKLTGSGSRVNFGFHKDLAYFVGRPDFLVLYCLRADARGEAATCVAEDVAALRILSAATRAVLREPLFQIRLPFAFAQQSAYNRWSSPRPLLTGPEEFPELCFNLNKGTRALPSHTGRARCALRALRRALTTPSVMNFVYLRPGDILCINQRKASHGRTSFSPTFDGRDRWLERTYVRLDLWPSRSGFDARNRVFRTSM